MNIKEMHEWYRQYAQQMGMQNSRVLLPEQIDLHINTSIYDTIKNIISEHIALTNRTVNENSKVGQINSLSTLYKTKEVDNISVEADGTILLNNIVHLINVLPTQSSDSTIHDDRDLEAMYVTSLSINYVYTKNGEEAATDWVPIRLIDDTLLANSLQDPALRPSINYPIAVLDSINPVVYLGKDPSSGNGNLKRTSVKPNKIRIGYIGFPTKVDYNNNISCNLPESLHIDILKHAVDLNTVAIQGSLFNSQKQQQRELQENASLARQRNGDDNQ